jgi:hypothetical protein
MLISFATYLIKLLKKLTLTIAKTQGIKKRREYIVQRQEAALYMYTLVIDEGSTFTFPPDISVFASSPLYWYCGRYERR